LRAPSAVLAALLALALGAAPALANHPNDDPSKALPFYGLVEGDVEAAPPMLRAGRFAFYTFVLPGDGAELTVEAEVTPGDTISASRAGFNVYGPTGGKLYAEGAQTATHPSHRATFTGSEAGQYTLQVFNFNVTPIHYQVRVLGLPLQPGAPPDTPTPAATDQPAPPAEPSPSLAATPIAAGGNSSPERAIELVGPVGGTLRGNPAGSYHYYRLDYPGDGSAIRLELTAEPPDPGVGPTFGLIVYGPTAGREYLRVGYGAGDWPRIGEFRSDERGTYVVQVGNYGAGSLGYRLTPSRAP
jgi:hypothetical protein